MKAQRDWAETDDRPVANSRRSANSPAIEKRAVPALQVFENRLVRIDRDAGMVP
jgi:hypothetical protein